MKRLISYILILLISFAFCYESLACFTKIPNLSPIEWIDDLSENESESDSNKMDDKDGKKEFKEYLNSTKIKATLLLNFDSLSKVNFHCYSLSDYSIVVYSPPEA